MRNFKAGKGDRVLSCLRFMSGLTSHLLSVVFVFVIFYISSPGSSLFSWHPVTMSLGMGLCMMEAILVFSPESSLCAQASRKNKVRAHWVLQSLSIALAWVGFITIVVNKSLHGKPHFKTWHGTLGLVTVSYTTLQACFGVLLIYPKIAKRYNWKLIQLKIYHATFGLVGFLLASVTMIVSLYSNFTLKNTDSFAWWLCLFALSWSALFIINQVSNTYSYYMARPSVPL